MTDEMNPRVQDPACGKDLDLANAAAMLDHAGWEYFFCSETCRDAFRADPGRFERKPGAPRSGKSANVE